MIKLFAIGGYSEVGRNMTALQVDDEVIIIDMGVYLPAIVGYEEEIEMLSDRELQKIGAIPDDSVIDSLKNKVKAILIGHAHLDHLWAAPYLAKNYNAPIIATPYTIEVLKKIYEDKERNPKNKLIKLNPNGKIKISNNITIEFIHITHSIPQTAMIAIHTKYGIILYANDFKLDNSPILGKKPNYEKLKSLKKVVALIVDSLYASREGKTPSEKVAKELLGDILLNTNNKNNAILVTTFSSHIARLQSILEFGEKIGRKVVFLGRSLNKYIDAAERINLVNFSKRAEILSYKNKIKNKLKEIQQNRTKYLIVCTGHQGEPDAVLAKIVSGYYKFPIKSGDYVIFSSSVIPNRENIEQRKTLDNKLKGLKVRLYTEVHASGHSSREDLRHFIEMVNPRKIIPAHANPPELRAMSELAQELGYKVGTDVYILKDGQSLIIVK